MPNTCNNDQHFAQSLIEWIFWLVQILLEVMTDPTYTIDAFLLVRDVMKANCS